MTKVNIPEDISKLTFEQAVAELEMLVAKMEAGGQTLDELTANFERGSFLNEHCRKQLAGLKKRIAIFSGDPEKDDDKWQDFDENSGKREDDLPF